MKVYELESCANRYIGWICSECMEYFSLGAVSVMDIKGTGKCEMCGAEIIDNVKQEPNKTKEV